MNCNFIFKVKYGIHLNMELHNQLWYIVYENLTDKSKGKFSCIKNIHGLDKYEIKNFQYRLKIFEVNYGCPLTAFFEEKRKLLYTS